jgi:hypothetical protein
MDLGVSRKKALAENGFERYSVGYGELENQVPFQSRGTVGDHEVLESGRSMVVIAQVRTTDDDGNDTSTYAFLPSTISHDAGES